MDESKKTILIIEDEGLLSRMYSQKLESDGFACLIAQNGKNGVEMAKAHKPTLIICDMMMPEMDGLQVIQELKADLTTKDIPFIILSNLSEEEYVSKAMSMGADKYLVKNNLIPADIITAIKEVLQKAQ